VWEQHPQIEDAMPAPPYPAGAYLEAAGGDALRYLSAQKPFIILRHDCLVYFFNFLFCLLVCLLIFPYSLSLDKRYHE
jgi:hypothetical protein